MRIIIVILDKEEVSTKEILEEMNIPQATLYRYVSKLEKNNIIHVVRTEYKRGSYEKFYRLVYDPIQELNEISIHGTNEEKQNMFMMFMLSIVDQHNKYLDMEGSDMIKDQTGFRTYPLYLTKEENQSFIQDFGALLGKYISHKKVDDRMQYHFSFVHLKGVEE